MMSEHSKHADIAVVAHDVPPRKKVSAYPEPFFSRMRGREKRALGDYFNINNFGVNLLKLAPGSESALMHRHTKQDEFIYVLSGTVTLVTDVGERDLSPGMCAGFPAQGIAHQLVNRSGEEAFVLEVGDRTPGDQGSYPNDDLAATLDSDGKWMFTHKDGTPYE